MKKLFLFLLLVPAMLVQAAEKISIAQFIVNADPNTTYRLRGVVSKITNTTYGNFDLTDETGTILVYGLKTATGETKQFASLGVEEGDTLTLDGKYKLYGSTPEVDPAQYVSHVKPSDAWVPVPISISDFISLNDGKRYILTGVVTNIANTQYGNFTIQDNTGSIFVYGLPYFSSYGIDEGDTVTVTGVYTLYGTTNEVASPRYVSHSKPVEVWVPVSKKIRDFIDLNDGKRYILRGVVSNITDNNNGHFTLTDETADIIVWGIAQKEDGNAFSFAYSDIAEGDTLSMTGIYQLYNNVDEVASGHYISHVHPTSNVPVELLRVCAQNLENYYYNYNLSTRPDYSDAEGFRAKTLKIVNAMLNIDADIYAFCEVEAKPIVLQQLADSMNAYAGVAGRYAAVYDGIDYTWYEGITDNQLKSGFIYRTDKVATVGSNYGVRNYGYYGNTMRIQAFQQRSNKEKFVVSMNHFKAKDSSEGQGENMRMINASELVNTVNNVTTDPDILILGDLNCEATEAPIQTIINAGFEEQLLKYNSEAWSHCYGGGELIDHVLANSSMAEQIVNAYVAHICAYWCNNAVTEDMSWSDHDPYVIEIKLGKPSGATALETVHMESSAKKVLRQGQLIIIRDGVEYTITGQRVY